ncbi:hypothetical protein CAEBREN_08093 [Caenorhabditis brenneri]|uniref:Uncharacterized protein n=1 Tax=Caenorhabditis brenneri TaxID=135651 RepID=G0NMP2_CAEBE|nr:hypothetical protein CAEBREN_08093 [Caenorhabditis brenneri]
MLSVPLIYDTVDMSTVKNHQKSSEIMENLLLILLNSKLYKLIFCQKRIEKENKQLCSSTKRHASMRINVAITKKQNIVETKKEAERECGRRRDGENTDVIPSKENSWRLCLQVKEEEEVEEKSTRVISNIDDEEEIGEEKDNDGYL